MNNGYQNIYQIVLKNKIQYNSYRYLGIFAFSFKGKKTSLTASPFPLKENSALKSVMGPRYIKRLSKSVGLVWVLDFGSFLANFSAPLQV